jgi:pimeloyl-ACP methyl ester carboxylesterase
MGVTVLLELYRVRPDLVRAMVLIAGGADHPYASSALFRVPGVRSAIRNGLRAAAPLVPSLSPLARRVTASRALFALAQSVGAIGPDAPREEVEHFFRSVGAMDLRAYWETLRSLMEAHASDVLPRVRVPVLIVAPERDVMAPRADLEALRDSIPGADFVLVPRASHAVLLEAGATIASRVRALVAEVSRTGQA